MKKAKEIKPDLRKLFGAHKFSESTEKLIREMDKELENFDNVEFVK